MAQAKISLSTNDGEIRIATEFEGRRLERSASRETFDAIQRDTSQLLEAFESGYRPFADPVALTELGRRLRDDLLPEDFVAEIQAAISAANTRLLFSSADPTFLNLPWELLPAPDGQFLVNDARCSIRRTVRANLPASSGALVASPLRVLFAACAPTDLVGLDYEKEEEAILRIAHQLGGRLHLDFAEAGTFEELRDLISEYKPHIVHLSGHSSVDDGIGSFAFENERGKIDSRDAREMAEQLFAGRDVRMVFVNGCQTSRAAAAGVCQTLTAAGHVPLALGWGASIADDRATDFTRVLYHELGAGQPIDLAASTARRDLLTQCRVRQDGVDLLDASFALPQVYAADTTNELVDQRLPPQPPARPGVRYELLGDNIRGLREGFIGRRRLLQNTRPALRSGEKNILLLTGIGGAGKSTFTTRLANRFVRDGYRVVALQARREETAHFCLRLVTELATACQRLRREADERVLLDGDRPLENRLRLAVEILNEARIFLVLDNLEALMPLPPAEPVWEVPEFASFFRELFARLTGEGRAILTCRYLPADLDPTQPNFLHEQMPEFTVADFFKYLRRHEGVQRRIDRGELTRSLLELFHRKLGGTPRFLEQATAILSTVDADRLLEQLENLASPLEGSAGSDLWQLQQEYFRDLFLLQLYEALPPVSRLALSRIALMEVAIPLDGVESVGGLPRNSTEQFVRECLGLTLLQPFGEADEVKLYAIYPLQREFLTDPIRLPANERQKAHQAAAIFLRNSLGTERQRELRLHFMATLFACLHHAAVAGDMETHLWATRWLVWHLIKHAEYGQAMALLDPFLCQGRQPDVLYYAAQCALNTSSWRKARDLSKEEQRERQRMGDHAGEARIWNRLAVIDTYEGNYAMARENFEKALSIQQAIGDRSGEAATLNNLSSVEMREGNYGIARKKLEEALSLMQVNNDPSGEASTWDNLALVDMREGDYPAAQEKLIKALAMRQEIGDRPGEAETLHNLASVEMFEGNYGIAREKLEKALTICESISNRSGEAKALHQMASIDLDEGHYMEARDKLERVLAMRRSIGDRPGEAATLHQLGSIDFHERDYPQAREKLESALAMRQSMGDRPGEAETLHQLASVELKLVNYPIARDHFEKSLAIKRAIGDREGEAATWHQLAAIDGYEGNPVAERQKFEKALAINQEIGARAKEAAVLHNLGSIHMREASYSQARQRFEKALAISREIGAREQEASTLGQIGLLAWKISQKECGLRLMALSLAIKQRIASGGVQQNWRNLSAMAQEMKVNSDQLNHRLEEVFEEYECDRGAKLVEQAFIDLDQEIPPRETRIRA